MLFGDELCIRCANEPTAAEIIESDHVQTRWKLLRIPGRRGDRAGVFQEPRRQLGTLLARGARVIVLRVGFANGVLRAGEVSLFE